jgi:hypothetical protein
MQIPVGAQCVSVAASVEITLDLRCPLSQVDGAKTRFGISNREPTLAVMALNNRSPHEALTGKNLDIPNSMDFDFYHSVICYDLNNMNDAGKDVRK